MSCAPKMAAEISPGSENFARRVSALVSDVQQSNDLARIVSLARSEDRINVSGGFGEYLIDLSGNQLTSSTGTLFSGKGYQLLYLLEGSNPGGRLDIDFEGGGRITNVPPGFRLDAPFDGFILRRGSRSISTGYARLLTALNPGARAFDVPQTPSGQLLDPVDLYGVSATPSFQAITEDTQPSVATDGFLMTGWKRLRVLVDGRTGGVDATDFDLVPWFYEPTTALWYEQRKEVLNFNGIQNRYVGFTLDVTGNGRLYFEIENLLAAARTGVGFIVQGIA